MKVKVNGKTNSNGNNSDLGIIEKAVQNGDSLPPPQKDDFSDLEYLEIGDKDIDGIEKTKKKKSRKLSGALILIILAIAGSLFYWSISSNSHRTKIAIPVRDNQTASRSKTDLSAEDVTAAAIAEIRATASPSPFVPVTSSPTDSTAPGTDNAFLPTTVPIGGTVSSTEVVHGSMINQTVDPLSSTSSKLSGIVSHRNEEKSIRAQSVKRSDPLKLSSSSVSSSNSALITEKSVTVPPFGSMLPIKTLGAVFTLRPSIVRFEITRDVSGPGWSLHKGTKILGQVQGSEYDRAYISLQGLIDSSSGKFVRISGEILDSDGSPGMKGKRRKVGSRWTKILSKSFDAGVVLGQAALNRGSGATIIMPSSFSSDLALTPSTYSRREFVEISAGSPAFLLFTGLPQEVKGGAPKTGEDYLASNSTTHLSDAELAELLESGKPEQIRDALPRMSPEMRTLAQAVLKESGK